MEALFATMPAFLPCRIFRYRSVFQAEGTIWASAIREFTMTSSVTMKARVFIRFSMELISNFVYQ
jgi:hypothetical protein